MSEAQDDSESPPPSPSVNPFAFMRRPLFVFSLLFLLWIFLGHAATHFMPHQPLQTTDTVPVKQETAKQEALPAIQQAIKDTENTAKIADLQRRLEKMESNVKVLQSVPTTPVKPAEDNATAAKIAALQASLDALQKAHSAETGDAAHMAQVLQKQEEDIAALKTQLAAAQAQALRRLSLMASFEALKDAVARGESFAEPFKRMNGLAQDDAPVKQLLSQLAPYANDNPATLPMLQNQFESAIPRALAPNASNAFTRHLESMIRIRKVGEQQAGDSDEAIIARAEAKLSRGDVKDCVSEIKALSPNGSPAFAAWKQKALAFLTIRDTLKALQPALLQDMPAAAGPAPQPAVKQ